jgi:hypothetical protein
MSNIRRTYTNAAAKSPIAPTSASAAATSRPASAVSTPALPSPPPSPAPVQLLCTPALLSLQATLLKSTSGLAAALVTWQGHFSVCERIISSLGNVTPRWQTLVKEEAARIRSQEEQEQRSTRNGGLQLADDASYFSEPLPSSGQKKPGNESSAALGVLASLPGVVPKLALQHERQIEVAWKLLLQTQSVRRQYIL